MSYLLDTSVVREAKRPEPDAKVLAWLAKQPPSAIYLSVITLGELQEGISALGETGEARALQGWLEQLRQGFAGRILDVTPEIAATWGRLRAEAQKQGQTAVAVDLLLIATAVRHSLTLVTENTVNFGGMPVSTLDPWV